jgi:hypothetical protein
MKTHHELQFSDPALGLLDLPETSATGLLEPLFELRSASLLAQTRAVTIDGEQYELPKMLLLGARGGGVPIRVGIFAGFDAGGLDTVAATVRLLLQGELSPALIRDYALFAYPVVNAPGFGPDRAPHAALQHRWARNSGDEDARYFRSELGRIGHHVIIQLRSSGVNTAFTATTRSELLAREVVGPALRSLAPLVPVGGEPVRVLSPSVEARRADFAAGRLLPDPVRRPWPFEIELYAPGGQPSAVRACALFLAVVQILRRYRRFIAHGGEL